MLSVLDRSRTRTGWSDAEAVTATIERAVRAEALGYERFWVAEHHGVPGIASGAPTVLLAAIGARTSSIRLGTGGVMLPLHQPLVVAEQLLVLEAMYPGRVEAGLGRSLGFTTPVRRALRRGLEEPDTFETDLVELRSYLDGSAAVTARPASDRVVPLSVLATGRGAAVAARRGMPVVLGGPVLRSDDLGEVLHAYRTQFVPHDGSRPWVSISLDVLVADDDASARDLALPEAWALARSRQTGVFGALDTVATIRSSPWPAQVRSRVESTLDQALAGGAATVRRGLEQLVDRTGADELMASTSTYDPAALHASDSMLRELVS